MEAPCASATYGRGTAKHTAANTSACIVGRRASQCKDCGTGHCVHGRQKSQCNKCGTGTCVHGRRKSRCTSCGTGTCEHGRQKIQCASCGTGGVPTTADIEAAIAFFGGGAGGASGPIVGTASVIRHGTKRQAVGSEQQLCAKRGPPSETSETWACSVCTFVNDKPLAPVCVVCGSWR
jgi:hypothetical protein